MTNQEYYEELCEKAEKFDRYRIHDLTKNPEDLPERREEVIIFYEHDAKGIHFTAAFIGTPVYSDGTLWEPDSGNTFLGWARFPRWED